jgi:hypothetical protein
MQDDKQECQIVSGMRLPGETLPKVHVDYATDGLTEPLKPLVPEGDQEQDSADA